MYINFHSLDVRKRWVVAVRREKWQPTATSYLCSQHFKETDFRIGKKRKLLRESAIPSRFCFSRPSPKKRSPRVPRAAPSATAPPPQDQNQGHAGSQQDGDLAGVAHLQFHNYAHSPRVEDLSREVDALRRRVKKQSKTILSLRSRLHRTKKEKISLMEELKNARMPTEGLGIVEENFKEIEQELVKKMISSKKKTATFPKVVMEFAQTVFYYSPRAYRSLVKVGFSLPSIPTLRRKNSVFQCMPGT